MLLLVSGGDWLMKDFLGVGEVLRVLIVVMMC